MKVDTSHIPSKVDFHMNLVGTLFPSSNPGFYIWHFCCIHQKCRHKALKELRSVTTHLKAGNFAQPNEIIFLNSSRLRTLTEMFNENYLFY